MAMIDGVHCLSVSGYWDNSTTLTPLPYIEFDAYNNVCYNVIDRSVMEDSVYLSLSNQMTAGSVLPEMISETWTEFEVVSCMIPINSADDVIKQCAPADSTIMLINNHNITEQCVSA